AMLQAMYAQQFHPSDAGYSKTCLDAALRCWSANPHAGHTEEMSWWALAALELHRTTGDAAMRKAGEELAGKLTGMQRREAVGGVRGFWPMSPSDPEPYKHAVHGALPAFALLELARAWPDAAGSQAWRDAARLYIDGYVIPMCAGSAYGIVPFGI